MNNAANVGVSGNAAAMGMGMRVEIVEGMCVRVWVWVEKVRKCAHAASGGFLTKTVKT